MRGKKTKSSGNEDLGVGLILSFPRGFKIASKQIPITQFEDFAAR